MAAAVAEQRQHGANVGRDALHQQRQSARAGAVHVAEQIVPDRTEIVLESVAA